MKVDGIKTGHTEAAGYGITLSAKDPASNRHLVLVHEWAWIPTLPAHRKANALLKWGLANFQAVKAFSSGACYYRMRQSMDGIAT